MLFTLTEQRNLSQKLKPVFLGVHIGQEEANKSILNQEMQCCSFARCYAEETPRALKQLHFYLIEKSSSWHMRIWEKNNLPSGFSSQRKTPLIALLV